MKLFIDVSPAFYKTMLFNAINKREEILVAYQDVHNRPHRSEDFFNGRREFANVLIKGNLFRRFIFLVSLLGKTRYREMVVGGYSSICAWLSVILSSRERNAVIVESTIRETRRSGVLLFLKRLFFRRVNKAYVCGKAHADLVKYFGFSGEIVDIGSVGFIHRVPQPAYKERSKVEKFVYVGRLTSVKNLEWIISRFAAHQDIQLTIIGTGELEGALKAMATANIHFIGEIPNVELSRYYQEADVFILPSRNEPYGLVVEEALNNGVPVLVSHMIGCQDNLVVANKAGLVFRLDDIDDFEDKLSKIRDIRIYNQLRRNISQLDFEKFEENMVRSFTR